MIFYQKLKFLIFLIFVKFSQLLLKNTKVRKKFNQFLGKQIKRHYNKEKIQDMEMNKFKLI